MVKPALAGQVEQTIVETGGGRGQLTAIGLAHQGGVDFVVGHALSEQGEAPVYLPRAVARGEHHRGEALNKQNDNDKRQNGNNRELHGHGVRRTFC